MRIESVAVIVGLLALAPVDARADWEYTRWGMTPEQVASASKGAVAVLPEAKRKKVSEAHMENGAEGRYADGPLEMHVGFGFDDKTHGLRCVVYDVLDPKQSPELKEAMVKRYGPPDRTSKLEGILETLTWDKTDHIELNLVPDERAFAMHCKP